MLTVILTACKEADSIGKAIYYLTSPEFSGYDGVLEIIQISPDIPTLNAGKMTIKEINNSNVRFKQIVDENRGKPAAVNLGLREAHNELIILTDGDVHFEKGSLNDLITEFKREGYDAACGQVLSSNPRDNFMGYISHMMTAAAHHKRMIELKGEKGGHGTKIVKKSLSSQFLVPRSRKVYKECSFFPLSGYIMILNKKNYEDKTGKKLEVPEDCLVEDAYISYLYYNSGLKLGYIPKAQVYAKFPSTIGDYFNQKKRSTGGYLQLWDYGVVKKTTNSRSFWQELSYFWFPFKFASNLKELIWSIAFFPLRLYLWWIMWLERKVMKKDFVETWVRVESTK